MLSLKIRLNHCCRLPATGYRILDREAKVGKLQSWVRIEEICEICSHGFSLGMHTQSHGLGSYYDGFRQNHAGVMPISPQMRRRVASCMTVQFF